MRAGVCVIKLQYAKYVNAIKIFNYYFSPVSDKHYVLHYITLHYEFAKLPLVVIYAVTLFCNHLRIAQLTNFIFILF